MRASVWLLVLGSTLGWAGLDFARKLLADRLPARVALLWMTTLSCPLFLAWAAIAAPPQRWIWSLDYFAPALASVALNVAANLLYFRALQIAPFSQTLPMLSLTPVFASASALAVLGELPTGRQWLGAFVVVFGAVLLQAGRGGLRDVLRSLRERRGAQQMALVALIWSMCTTLDKWSIGHAEGAFHGFFLNAGVAVSMWAWLLVRREVSSPRAAAVPLAAALVVGALALGLQLLVLREVPVGWMETIKRGVGGFAAVALGSLWLAEPLSRRKVGAVAVMTAGVALLVL
jgi:drug/metabolite transporter (DMT)-like permease